MSKEKIEQTKKAAMVIFFAVAAFLSAWYKFMSPLEKPFHKTLNQTAKGTKATIVIDPGHGGFDPGKVGVNQTLEKDVNLAISEKLNQKLAASGYTVYMTRVSDEALCRGDESSKKRADMQNRVALIEEKNPDLVVSIHQNSFSASTKGAQVFIIKVPKKASVLPVFYSSPSKKKRTKKTTVWKKRMPVIICFGR